MLRHVPGDDQQGGVAVAQVSVFVRQNQAVGVAVQNDSDVALVFKRGLGGVFGGGCAAVDIDVESVRLVCEGNHLRAEFVKNGGGDMIGGAVGAVGQDFHSAQVQALGKGAACKFNVAPRRVVQPPGAPRLAGEGEGAVLREDGFYFGLHFVGEFFAVAAEEFDSVVAVGVVRGADDDADIQPQGLGEIGGGGGGQGAAQQHIDSGGGKSRLSADSTMYPESRVSLMMRASRAPRAFPAAKPRRTRKSGVIGGAPTSPRTPSVPKNFRGWDGGVIGGIIRGKPLRGKILSPLSLSFSSGGGVKESRPTTNHCHRGIFRR